jgi:Flp pilus assembly protein CpaB
MGRVIVFILVAALIAGVVARNMVRARRLRKEATPEINKHPERLDQMLDPTDDA